MIESGWLAIVPVDVVTWSSGSQVSLVFEPRDTPNSPTPIRDIVQSRPSNMIEYDIAPQKCLTIPLIRLSDDVFSSRFPAFGLFLRLVSMLIASTRPGRASSKASVNLREFMHMRMHI